MNVECDCTNKKIAVQLMIAYEEALYGALVAGREKERELATTILHIGIKKVNAKCFIARMTLVMTSLPLVRAIACFSMFVYISRSFWLRADWQKSDSSVALDSLLAS